MSSNVTRASTPPHRRLLKRWWPLVALLFLFCRSAALAQVALLGDLDQDGKPTVLDLQRLINHLNRTHLFSDALAPYGDLNEDGLINTNDLQQLQNAILGLTTLPNPYAAPVASAPVDATNGTGFFVGPVLRRTEQPATCAELHDREVFGPVATVGSYGGDPAEVAALVARGAGGLVASIYSDDRDWLGVLVPEAAGWHGRLYLGSAKMAAQSPGPGTALPSLTHGGPGRAGGGEELGGERGMHLYMQRCALEGDTSVLKTFSL